MTFTSTESVTPAIMTQHASLGLAVSTAPVLAHTGDVTHFIHRVRAAPRARGMTAFMAVVSPSAVRLVVASCRLRWVPAAQQVLLETFGQQDH